MKLKKKLVKCIVDAIKNTKELNDLWEIDRTFKGRSENELSEKTQQQIHNARKVLLVRVQAIIDEYEIKNRLRSVYGATHNNEHIVKNFSKSLIDKLEGVFPPTHSEFFTTLIKREIEEFIFEESLRY